MTVERGTSADVIISIIILIIRVSPKNSTIINMSGAHTCIQISLFTGQAERHEKTNILISDHVRLYSYKR